MFPNRTPTVVMSEPERASTCPVEAMVARKTAFELGEDYAGQIVDTCVFHDWPSMRTLEPYLSRGWKELIFPRGQHVYPSPIRSSPLYQNPLGSKAAEAYPPAG